MADEAAAADAGGGGGGGGGGAPAADCPKCPECPPEGLPAWMGTFSDLVTLLLTFFVLLLSFAKTETNKYATAMGSIRNAFGGNVLKAGKVLQLGKSPDDSPTMLDSQNPIRPFPIEFLTMEGLLDKQEVNRESSEDLMVMKQLLREYKLDASSNVYEMPEGIKVRIKDKIYFEEGSVKVKKVSMGVFEKMVSLLRDNDWTIFVEGHSSRGEVMRAGQADAMTLSAKRAEAVTKLLIKKGLRPRKITTVFYGDSRPDEAYRGTRDGPTEQDRRVEFIIRKVDLRSKGHKVSF